MRETERKRAYHPRGPHKEGCQCSGCKIKRGVEVIPVSEPEPIMVRVDSLRAANKFEFEGARWQVNEFVEGMVVCYNFLMNNAMTISGSTMVEPVK